MKSNLFLLFLFVIVTLSACKKDKDNLYQAPHDSNQMMVLMHSMMDSMNQMTMTNDPDIDFSMMMRMHHMGAIKMAQLELASGTDTMLRTMAQKMIDDQTREIQELDNYLMSHMTADNMDTSFAVMSNQTMQEMQRQADVQVISDITNQDFATLMIVHHQSATDMANAYLLKGSEPTLKSMANTIISTQQAEIKELQNWLIPFRKK